MAATFYSSESRSLGKKSSDSCGLLVWLSRIMSAPDNNSNNNTNNQSPSSTSVYHCLDDTNLSFVFGGEVDGDKRMTERERERKKEKCNRAQH